MARFVSFLSLRSPLWPALFSALLWPGAGQFLNGDLKKGGLLLLATFGSYTWFIHILHEQLRLVLPGSPEQWNNQPQQLLEALNQLVRNHPSFFLTFLILMLMLWSFGVLDAYATAKRRRSRPAL